MKSYKLFALCLFLAGITFLSCDKKGGNNSGTGGTTLNSNSLAGRWTLTHVSGTVAYSGDQWGLGDTVNKYIETATFNDYLKCLFDTSIQMVTWTTSSNSLLIAQLNYSIVSNRLIMTDDEDTVEFTITKSSDTAFTAMAYGTWFALTIAYDAGSYFWGADIAESGMSVSKADLNLTFSKVNALAVPKSTVNAHKINSLRTFSVLKK
ncbi:MAG: hypothetical protein LBR36_06245 [Bacteroidales bacterium]|jgi:hypothetical protein|nr:hypothetical protein [Bacteroidales bacterium]